ncbi:beta strand repeat-containing protein, partial [Oceanibaculum pacificum]|uniref:beta strand repeat-containing protein n=1 Tax=Oceanibaculum pacificum TaxID=580166 RepID=UPI001E36E215
MSSATVSITGGFQSAEDVLAFTNVGGGTHGNITGSYDAGTGVLNLTSAGGTATVAQWQAAMQAVTYENTSDSPDTADRTISFQVNDGVETSATVTQTVTVTAVNDAPTATNLTQSKSFTEDGGAVTLDDIVITDVDTGDTVTATLTLSDADGGALSTGTYGSATSTYNDGTGVWTVTGSVADVNAALAAVTFTPAANYDQGLTITTHIHDLANDGPDDGEITLTATAVNDAPVATVPGSISVMEDVATALTGISFSDVDAGSGDAIATLSVASGTLAATSGAGVTVGGTASALTLTGTVANINAFIAASNVTFTTASNATADVTLTVSINDDGNSGSGGELSDSGTVTLDVTAVNDAPVVTAPDSLTVTEDVAGAVTDISFSDVDAGSGDAIATLSVASGTLAATSGAGVTVGGTASALTLTGTVADINAFIVAEAVSFKTAQDATDDVTLTIAIDDGGYSGSGGAQQDSTAITINVTAENDAPTDITLSGNNIDLSAAESGAVVATLTTMDIDDDSGFSYSLVGGADQGSFAIDGDGLKLAEPLKAGSYEVEIQTEDAGGETYSDTFTIIVVDDIAPTVASVSAVESDGPYKFGDEIDITVTFSEAVKVEGDGVLELLLELGDTDRAAIYSDGTGTDTLTFSYVVQTGDESLDLDYVGTGSLTLEDGTTITDAEGNAANLTLPTPGAADSLGANKNIVIDGVLPTVKSVTPSVDTVTDGQVGSGTFTLTLVFSEAMDTEVAPTIDFPTGDEDPAGTLSFASGAWQDDDTTYVATYNVADINAVVGDIDVRIEGAVDAAGNEMAPATENDVFSIVTAPSPGILSIGTVTPDGSYKADDEIGITVTFDESVVFTANGGSLVATLSNGATVTLANADETSTSFTGTYTVGADDDDSADLSVASIALQGGATLLAQDDALPALLSVPDDENLADNADIVIDTTPPEGSVPDLSSDSDSGVSTSDNYTKVTTPSFTGTGEVGASVELFDEDDHSLGTATVDSEGTWTITLEDALDEGVQEIVAIYTDKAGNSFTSTALSLTIDTTPLGDADGSDTVGEDDAPGTVADLVDGSAGNRVVSVAGSDENIGEAITGGEGGLFTIDAEGAVTFDPNGDFDSLATDETADTVIVAQVADKAGNISDASYTVTVTGVNDAPVLAVNKGASVQTGQTVTITTAMLNEGDVDDDGEDLTYTVSTLPTGGTLLLDGVTVSEDGTFTQQDIDDSKLTFKAGASAGGFSFAFDLADDENATLADQSFTLTVTNPPTTPPTEPTNPIVVTPVDPTVPGG